MRKGNIIIEAMSSLLVSFLLIFAMGCESADDVQKINFKDTVEEAELNREPLGSDKEEGYLFGFDIRINPQEDARQYLPFLKYLGEKTGLNFDLRFTPNSTNIVDLLGEGEVHFAAIGADTYIQAHRKYDVIPLVRGLNTKGKAKYQSAIVVAPGSSLVNINQLQDKLFAFGSQTSTQGHLIPRILLAQNNIYLKDLRRYDYTGSHNNCANAVASGSYDACGMQDTLAKDLEKLGLIKILYMSPYYPSSGIAVNKIVTPEIIAEVKNALIDFQPKGRDASGLYNWEKTEMPNGFVVAQDEDYHELRNWVERLGY